MTEKIKFPLPCFVCGEPLEPAYSPDLSSPAIEVAPYPALVFQAHGNYGSTLFDPMSQGIWMEINICDSCVVKNKERAVVVESTYHRPTYEVQVFDPENMYPQGYLRVNPKRIRKPDKVEQLTYEISKLIDAVKAAKSKTELRSVKAELDKKLEELDEIVSND